MGNTTCVGATYTGDNSAPDMTQYANLKTGETFTHPGFCEYCGPGYSSVNCGNNGEFTPSGDGSGKCACRALCTNSCCRKNCQRISYATALDATAQCCQAGGPSYYKDSGGIVRTCDPSVRAANWAQGTCNPTMKVYCAQGTNLFTPVCRQWVTTFNAPGATPSGDVDGVLISVCNKPENANRVECGCVTAANAARAAGLSSTSSVPVQCLVKQCANQPAAYRTSTQMTPCNVTNCQMTVQDLQLVSNNKSGIFNTGFAQNCGTGGSTSTTPTPTTPGTPNVPGIPSTPSTPGTPDTSGTPSTSSTSTLSNILSFVQTHSTSFIVGGIVLMMIILLIVVLTSGGKKTTTTDFGGDYSSYPPTYPPTYIPPLSPVYSPVYSPPTPPPMYPMY
jgi:hypothetical protein